MGSKKSKSVKLPRTKKMDVILEFREGKLIGWSFIARDEEGENIIEDLMSGKIPGLEYCEDKTIRPIAGGGDTYCIGFPVR